MVTEEQQLIRDQKLEIKQLKDQRDSYREQKQIWQSTIRIKEEEATQLATDLSKKKVECQDLKAKVKFRGKAVVILVGTIIIETAIIYLHGK